MRTYLLLLSGLLLIFLTTCDHGINAPGNPGEILDIDPGPVNAVMNIGKAHITDNHTANLGKKMVTNQQFHGAPVTGDIEGAFDGTITAELTLQPENGYHKGEGRLKLENGLVFEVQMSGNTIDSRDSGYLQGFDQTRSYEIRARYTEENSHRGMMSRPLKIEGAIEEVPYHRSGRY